MRNRRALRSLLLLTLLGLLVAPRAGWTEEVLSRMLIIFDTSGSMTWGPRSRLCTQDAECDSGRCAAVAGSEERRCDPNVTCGDGSADHPGLDLDANGQTDDSRLYQAKTALRQMLAGTSELDFALIRFPQNDAEGINSRSNYHPVRWFAADERYPGSPAGMGCDRLVPSVINYIGANYCTGIQGELLVPFGPDAAATVFRWIDGVEIWPENKELRGDGNTQIGASLRTARDEFARLIAGDVRRACRHNSVLLLTDDANDSCDDDAKLLDAARALRTIAVGEQTYEVKTYVVGFGEDAYGSALLDDLAVEGGTGGAFFSDDLVGLQVALNRVIHDAIPPETCDGIDNDCDGETDERRGRPCATVCGDGTQACQDGQWGACTAGLPGPEVCDGRDNDCDGQLDEELTRDCGNGCGPGTEICLGGRWQGCSAPVPTPEACNGQDDNCDGATDEGLTEACHTSCGAGQRFCVAGSYGPCSAPQPGPETCDGLDNNCDGATDEGLTQACETACGPGEEECELGAWVRCSAPAPLEEICDGQDNDCDGDTDEGLTRDCTNDCGAGLPAIVAARR